MKRRWAFQKRRAGEGNRTLVVGLGSRCSTIELHPRRCLRVRIKNVRLRFTFLYITQAACLHHGGAARGKGNARRLLVGSPDRYAKGRGLADTAEYSDERYLN